MKGHTPGPWRVESSDEYAWAYHLVGRAKGGRWLTTQLVPDERAEDEANARLIAAAPDLLEACKLCLQWWGHESDDTSGHATRLARTAIAKAEGQ